MRKLVIIVSSLTLVFILLMSMGMPVMAAKPEEKNDNKPVAWVDANINYASFMEPHSRHSLNVKYLVDGSTVGQVVGGSGQNRMYSTELPGLGTFVPGMTYFWDWTYPDGTYVKFAQFCVILYIPTYGGEAPCIYQIADYGESGRNDWHRVFTLNEELYIDFGIYVWEPMWGPFAVPYYGGNAKIHGDLTITGPPQGNLWTPPETFWEEDYEPLLVEPIRPPWPK